MHDLGKYALSPRDPPCTHLVQDQGGRGAGLGGCALRANLDLVLGPDAPCDSHLPDKSF